MFETARAKIAAFISRPPAPAPKNQRMFAGAAFNRLTDDWVASSTSVDSEVVTSLRTLRNRARQLVRDNDYARNAVRIIRNNVIGQGIGFQAQATMLRGGKLNDAINSTIEAAWNRWKRPESCSTSGKYSFTDIERLVVNALPESGEIFIRIVKKSFGNSAVPFSLEVIESDLLVDTYTVGRAENGNQIRMGVEIDEWMRPTAYYLYPHHPGDMMFAGQPQPNRYIRVPANEIIHLGITYRPNQTRFTPWFASVLKRLNNIAGYEEAEIIAARASAAIMGFIETPEPDSSFSDATKNGERITNLAPGTINELYPGEKFTGFAPSRPNPGMEPFMRYMLRAMGAGLGVSYAPLANDYSQANYSSERASQLRERDEWRALQSWLIEHFHQRVYEAWLDMAVLSGALKLPAYDSSPEMYQAVRWMPRGWDWVDPLKDAMAQKLAVRSGFTTVADVISGKGGDIEDVMKQRRREIDLAANYNLVLETDPAQVNDKGEVQPLPPIDETDTGEVPEASGADASQKMANMVTGMETRIIQHLEGGRDLQAAALMERLEIIEAQASRNPVFNLTMPAVTIADGAVRVEPKFDIAPPEVRIDNHVAAPQVTVQHPVRSRTTVERDSAGDLTQTITEFEDK